MRTLLDNLDGYKTYLLTAVAALVWISYMLNWLTLDTLQEVYILLGIGGVATARSAIKKIE